MRARLDHIARGPRKGRARGGGDPVRGLYALIMALSLAGGAAGYLTMPGEPTLPALVLASGLALLAWLAAGRARWAAILVPLSILALGGAGGALAGKLRAMSVAAPVVAAPTGPLMLEGWLTEIEAGGAGPRLRIDVSAIGGWANEAVPRRVRVTHTNSLTVGPGRFVRCRVVLRPPPAAELAGDYDFRRQAYFEGLGAVGYVQGRCRGGAVGAPDNTLRRAGLVVQGWRRRLAEHVTIAAGERAGGFAAAMATGDRSFLAPEDRDALRGSGLAHLLAISGLHIGIVGGLVYLIVRRGLALIEPLALRIAVQKPAAAAALFASAAYLVVSGASVSTQRAFIMAAVFFGAILIDRAALSVRSFSIAMILVVLTQPEGVVGPGFQMSFAATGALIATYEAWTRRRRDDPAPARRGVVFAAQSVVVTSLIASMATAPFALFHFGRVAPLGLAANLLAMPVISLLTAPAAALTLLLALFGQGDLGLRLIGLSLEFVLAVAHAFDGAEMPGWSARLGAMPVPALLALTSGLVLASILRGGWRAAGGLAGALLAGAFWAATPPLALHLSASGDVYVRGPDGAMERVAFTDGDALGPLRFSDLAMGRDCRQVSCGLDLPGGRLWLAADPPGSEDCVGAASILWVVPPDAGPAPLGGSDGPAARSATCPGLARLPFGEVAARGGISYSTRDPLLSPPARRCRARPWAPCAGLPHS